MKKRIDLIIMFISILSMFLISFTYVSLFISILCLILSLIFSRDNLRILFITIFIVIATIITNIFVLYNNYKMNIDIEFDDNILMGTFNYVNYEDSYIFNEDNTFIHYFDIDKNNYCSGSYSYSYGAIDSDGNMIKQDKENYYFDLYFDINSCILDDDYNDKVRYVVSLNKVDNNSLIFMDIDNNMAYMVNRVE